MPELPETKNVIGLFGTCDNIRWRDPFMARYNELGIAYFNPMVDDWNASCIPIEAHHLANDSVVLFPILDQSYGLGSLSEMGFGPLRAMRQNSYRSFVFLVHDDVTPELWERDASLAKASKRARALVKWHLVNHQSDNILLVETLEDMLKASIKLHRVHTLIAEVSDLRRTA